MNSLTDLRKMRNDRQLSLRALASVAGISVAYLSNLEHGKSSPTVEVVDKLCTALGVSRDALLGKAEGVVATVGTVSIEQLSHLRCGLCQGWWSVAAAPADKHEWYCPWCGELNDMTHPERHEHEEER